MLRNQRQHGGVIATSVATLAIAILAIGQPFVPPSAAAAVSEVTASNLILDYDFEGLDLDTAVVADKSGNGRDGFLANPGSSTLVQRPDGGSALSLPGGDRSSTSASFVTIPKGLFKDLTQTTISSWVRWDGGDAFQWLYTLGKDASSATFFTPKFDGANVARSSVKPATNGAEVGASGGSELPSGEWHNVTTTIDADTLVYYLDGLEVSRTSVGADVATALFADSSPNSGYIGQPFWTGVHPFFDGAIDDFRVYDVALTAAQVVELVGDAALSIETVSQTTVSVRTDVGTAPNLPGGVTARYSDGQDRLAPVTWASVPVSAYADRGTFTVQGTVNATDTTVTATVTVKAPNELTIDVGEKTGDFLGGASGTLYGLYDQGLPSNNLIDAINLRTVSTKAQDGPQHPGADALEIVKPLADSSDGDVYIYMTDIYRGFPYEVPGSTGPQKEADFAEKIETQVNQVLALHEKYQDNIVFVPFNEPEGNMYGDGPQSFYGVSWLNDPARFFAGWDAMYRLIKDKMPDARIAGPNTSLLFSQVQGFLQHTVDADTVPDSFTWHELSEPASIRRSVDTYRGWERAAFAGTEYEGRELPINLNEYAFNYHTSVPAQMIQWIAALEDKKVDGDIAYWNIDGNLSDSAVQANRGNGQWWLLQSYANMSGQTVKVTPPRPNESYTLQGVATVDDDKQQIRALFGGSSGSQNVYFDRLPEYIGSSAHVLIRDIRWTGQIGDSAEPQTVKEFDAPVVGGSVSLGFGAGDLPGLGVDSAYEVVITPGVDTTSPSVAPFSWRGTYEAEDAAFTGSPRYLNGPEGTPSNVGGFYTSGTRNVGGIESGSTLELNFNVTVPSTGTYDLSVLANGFNKEARNLPQGPVNMFVRVDGAAEQEIRANLGYKWVVWDHTDTTVELTAGQHTITLAARSLDGTKQTVGAAIIDKIDLALANASYVPIYEAENGTFNGAVNDYSRAGVSGSGVANVSAGQSVTFWVYAAEDAEKQLTVDTLGGGTATVSVNGQSLGLIDSSTTLPAFLVGGINKVEVVGVEGTVAIDRVTVGSSAALLPTQTIEAESGVLSGAAAALDLSFASGGKAVGKIGGAPGNGATLTTTVTVDEPGTYAMTVRYSNEEQSPASHYNPDPVARRADISVNGTKQSVTFPHTFHQNQFWDLTVPVELTKGENTIVFSSEEQKSFDGQTYISDTFPGILLRSQYAPNIDRLTFTATNAPEAAETTVDAAVTGEPAGAAGWINGPATLTLTASNTAVALQYRVDGAEWKDYSEPVGFSVDGEYAVDYRAVHEGTPVAGAEGTVAVKVDRGAPSTTVVTDPASGTVTEGGTIGATFPAADTVSGIARTEYSVNGGAWLLSSSAGVSFTDVGSYSVAYRSVDVAGNVEAAKTVVLTVAVKAATASVKITSADPAANDGWYNQNVLVALAAPAGSAGVKIQYRLDGGAWKTYTNAITVTKGGQTVLDHRLLKSNVVVAGSEGQTVVKIDKTVPKATVVRSPASGAGTPLNPITLDFAGTDAISGVAGIEYKLNDGGWVTATDRGVVLDKVGDWLVSYRATDVAGNTAVAKTITVRIAAATQPVVKPSTGTITRGKTITLSVQGFVRWSDVEIVLGDRVLGTVLTDQNGTAKVTLRVPADAATGSQPLTATGERDISASTTVKVK